jgi:L-lactate dehydrogenase complex protein LldE
LDALRRAALRECAKIAETQLPRASGQSINGVMAGTVALFIPCFVDQLTPQVGLDTARVLERVGYSVHFPPDQTCCGQPAYNTGHWDDARPLAERFVRIFADCEAVVCPSGSCTTMVRKFYPELLAESPLLQNALSLGTRVYELSEFLVKVAKVTDVGAAFSHRVTFHDSCHALRELGIKNEPRELLRNVRGLELLEMPSSEECCGFGGMFAVKFGAVSAAMGDIKAESVVATGAEYVSSVDGSCLLHIDGVLRKRKDTVRAIHLASILAQEAK